MLNPSVQQQSFHGAVAVQMAEYATSSVRIMWCARRQLVRQDLVPVLCLFFSFIIVLSLLRYLLLMD
jgi:hypothetical protein